MFMLKQLLLAKCSLAHTYTHFKLLFFSPRETAEKSLDPNNQKSTRAPSSFLCTAHGGFLKPQSRCSPGKAAGRKLLLALSLLDCPGSSGLPTLQARQDEGCQYTPSAPGTSQAGPSLCQSCSLAPRAPNPAGGTAPPASPHSWVLSSQQIQR